jgi:hypothetical protein
MKNLSVRRALYGDEWLKDYTSRQITRKAVEGHGFHSDVQVEMAVRDWLRLQSPISTAMMY